MADRTDLDNLRGILSAQKQALSEAKRRDDTHEVSSLENQIADLEREISNLEYNLRN